MNIRRLEEIFINKYNRIPDKIYFSPGRVNLIGEHIDYNGGHVLPCAINLGTYGIFAKRHDNFCRLYSENYSDNGVIKIDLSSQFTYNEKDSWVNYVKGIIKNLKNKNYILNGFDVVIKGDIPNGAGLSSSASLEVLILTAINDMYNFNMTKIDIAKISQEAENEFVGVNCGIMDQFAVAMGKRNQGIFLNCKTLDYEYCPVKLNNAALVIANSNKQRALVNTQYNQRRIECDEALKILSKETNIQSLCDLLPEDYEKNKHILKNEKILLRTKHVIYENYRTIRAVKALKEGSIEVFGMLLNKSHESLKNNYEVSCVELDTLVEEAQKHIGCLGSRMTGAGFGGCTISIVKNKWVDDFIKKTGDFYEEKTGLQADFYIVNIGYGAQKIEKR